MKSPRKMIIKLNSQVFNRLAEGLDFTIEFKPNTNNNFMGITKSKTSVLETFKETLLAHSHLKRHFRHFKRRIRVKKTCVVCMQIKLHHYRAKHFGRSLM